MNQDDKTLAQASQGLDLLSKGEVQDRTALWALARCLDLSLSRTLAASAGLRRRPGRLPRRGELG